MGNQDNGAAGSDGGVHAKSGADGLKLHTGSVAVSPEASPPSVPERFEPVSSTQLQVVRTLLVGTGRLAVQAVHEIMREPTPRLVVGAIDTKLQRSLAADLPDVPWLGDLNRFAEIVAEHAIDEVCVALPAKSCLGHFESIRAMARELGVPVSFRLALFSDSQSGTARLAGGSIVLEFNRHPAAGRVARAGKRALDVIISIMALALSAPLWLVIAMAIKLTSWGPVLFRQERVGKSRRTFPMFKFRTMVANAEDLRSDLEFLNDARGISFKIFNDPRVTAVGKLLRRSSLDELPQLLNVLKGDMSLVGPRPIPLWVAEQLEGAMYTRRFSVLPGITGLWQVRGRIQDFDRMANMDLDYVDHWSFWLDLKILAATIPAMLRGENAI